MSDSEEYCLLLEDDFIVLDKIKLYVNEIKKGVQLGDVYTLGCIPFFSKAYGKHLKIIGGGGSHAVIYNKKARNIIKKWNFNKMQTIDTNIYYYLNTYSFYQPLIIQPYLTDTKNAQNWSYYYINKLAHFAIKLSHADTHPIEFHQYLYILPFGLFGSLILFIILLIFSLLFIQKKLQQIK